MNVQCSVIPHYKCSGSRWAIITGVDGIPSDSMMISDGLKAALPIFERMPVPVLAIRPDGTVLFANAAFAAMLGHTRDTVLGLRSRSIFHNLLAAEPGVTVMRASADNLVDLAHHDGYTVRSLMSKVAIDDDIALMIFRDLTEQLWNDTW